MATRSPRFSHSERSPKNSSSTRKRNSALETSIHCPFLLNLNASGLGYWSAECKSKPGRVETVADAGVLPSLTRIPASSFNMVAPFVSTEGEHLSPNKRTPLYAVHKAL